MRSRWDFDVHGDDVLAFLSWVILFGIFVCVVVAGVVGLWKLLGL